MKVIGRSNFNLETFREYVVEENLSPKDAEAMANRMNADLPETSEVYYAAMPDDYVPWLGMEDLVK